MAERLRTRSAALLGGLWDAWGKTGREPVVLRHKLSRDLSDSMKGSPMGPGQATWAALWTFMRLNAVAARCSSLVASFRPRREKRSMTFFRLAMPGSTVAPRRL